MIEFLKQTYPIPLWMLIGIACNLLIISFLLGGVYYAIAKRAVDKIKLSNMLNDAYERQEEL
jgi:hypothetical protein